MHKWLPDKVEGAGAHLSDIMRKTILLPSCCPRRHHGLTPQASAGNQNTVGTKHDEATPAVTSADPPPPRIRKGILIDRVLGRKRIHPVPANARRPKELGTHGNLSPGLDGCAVAMVSRLLLRARTKKLALATNFAEDTLTNLHNINNETELTLKSSCANPVS